MSSGSSSRAPAPATPAPMPVEQSPAVDDAKERARREAMEMRARGRESTILTQQSTPSTKATLLGESGGR